MLRMVALGFAAALAAACTKQQLSVWWTGMSFFVTSQRNPTGNLGGLAGADAMCSNLANAAGVTGKTWRAYLSAERDAGNGGRPTNARSRIGTGPWFNAKLVLVANNSDRAPRAQRRTRRCSSTKGANPINGQWIGSPSPVEHDIMTGSAADGTLLAGLTCDDWTSDSATTADAGRPLRRLRRQPRHVRRECVLEFSHTEPELLEHRAARRRGPHLLLRDELTREGSGFRVLGSGFRFRVLAELENQTPRTPNPEP